MGETTLLGKLASAFENLRENNAPPHDTETVALTRGELTITIKAIQAAVAIRNLVR